MAKNPWGKSREWKSSRNKAKPFKPQRIIEKKDGTVQIHPLDNLPLSATGKPVNSTGCFGTPQSAQFYNLSLAKQTKGKNRSAAKRKNVCKLFAGSPQHTYRRTTLQQVINLRADIFSLLCMQGYLPEWLWGIYHKIKEILGQELERDVYTALFLNDENKRKTLEGMVVCGIKPKKVKHLEDRINRMRRQLKSLGVEL